MRALAGADVSGPARAIQLGLRFRRRFDHAGQAQELSGRAQLTQMVGLVHEIRAYDLGQWQRRLERGMEMRFLPIGGAEGRVQGCLRVIHGSFELRQGLGLGRRRPIGRLENIPEKFAAVFQDVIEDPRDAVHVVGRRPIGLALGDVGQVLLQQDIAIDVEEGGPGLGHRLLLGGRGGPGEG